MTTHALGTPPDEIDLDGMIDPKSNEGIRYVGKAKRMVDGSYLCLADVGGALCRVEVRITFEPTHRVGEGGGR
ncbi:MAG TPA: hypothetical protein VM580_21080 [Labilithrix sp.]|jgi:hypothetical protein|nr:hypothetical protein [Labilithrix sp.]